MKSRHLSTLALLALLPALSGESCAVLVPKIRIASPVEGQELTWMPLNIEVDFQNTADFRTFEVLLNGHDISDRFAITGGGRRRDVATAEYVWDGFVLPGVNVLTATIQATSGPVSATTTFTTVGDPYADAVFDYEIGPGGGFRETDLPGVVLGPPVGFELFLGSDDVVSLGLSPGFIELRFDDNVIVDGPGVDFTVFENAFLKQLGSLVSTPFAEPGRVSVSQDGVNWEVLGDCKLGDPELMGEPEPAEPPWYPDCAGVRPVLADGTGNLSHASIPTPAGAFEALVGMLVFEVSNPFGAGGDSFDLADTSLSWARYVRIDSADFVPDGAAFPGSSGFDIDAVAAVNSAPATDEDGNGTPDAVE